MAKTKSVCRANKTGASTTKKNVKRQPATVVIKTSTTDKKGKGPGNTGPRAAKKLAAKRTAKKSAGHR